MSEIISITEPESDAIDIAIGIDFGTSNSQLSIIVNNEVSKIKSIPSVISFDKNNMPVVGKFESNNTNIFSVKRLLTYSEKDVEKMNKRLPYTISYSHERGVVIDVNGIHYTPIELSKFLLQHFLYEAELLYPYHEKEKQCVLTVPAWFNETERKMVHSSAMRAGWQVLRLIHEPTSAVIAYSTDNTFIGTALVVDCGGGTTDISVVSISKSAFKVEYVNGNNQLGGDDVDHLIYSHVTKGATGPTSSNGSNMKLLSIIKQAKEKISSGEIATITHPDLFKEFSLSQDSLETVSQPFLNKVAALLKQSCADIHDMKLKIDAVIPVGGMCKSPLVLALIKSIFPNVSLSTLDPQTVVGIGAAVHANALLHNSETARVLIDCLPISIGLETYGGVMEPVIKRLSSIPVAVAQYFTTWADNQTGIDFNIYQGEQPLVQKNHLLGTFKLSGLNPQPAGTLKVKVLFQIDADGVLTVSAEDTQEQRSESLQIKKIESNAELSHELSDAERKVVELITARIRANSLLAHLDNLARVKPLSGDIDKNRKSLASVVDKEDVTMIYKWIDIVEASAKEYSISTLNKALHQNMKGKVAKEYI